MAQMSDAERWSILEPGNLLIVQERERLLQRILRRQGFFPSLEGLRAFEAGCGTAYQLRQVVQWGARPEDQAGIDLDPVAIEHARRRSSGMRIHCGSLEDVPEPPAHFDITFAFTVFSSVSNEGEAQRIASELFRITKPGGLILLYDMRRGNRRRDGVHAIDGDDVRRWFSSCSVRSWTLTLAPPIARAVCRRAPWLYSPLAALPFLRTHLFWELRRPPLS